MATLQLKVMGSLLLAAAGIGCGRDTGYLYKEEPVQHAEAMGQGLPLFHYQKLTWGFECPSNTDHVGLPQATPTELVFKNQGPYRLKKSRLDGTAIKIVGEMCQPASFPRDVAIVIDVSGSMGSLGGNDPTDRGGKSCGRLRAFHAVMNSIEWSTTRVAALTFTDDVPVSSEGLFDSKDALISKLTDNNKKELYEILCDAIGGTEYKPALNEAAKILRTGREDASKELFFLTDGEPSDKRDAEERVDDLKADGITINGKAHPLTVATLMLGDDKRASEYLRDNFATKDTAGQFIHASVKEADKLAETLKNMVSKIELVGSVVEHGNATGMHSVDVLPHTQNFQFELPEFYLDPATLGDSYEFNLVYWDSRNNRYKIHGRLDFDE